MSLSIIVPVFNNIEKLDRFIKHILIAISINHSLKELIIIDDHSPEDLRVIKNKYHDEFLNKGINLFIHRNDINMGRSYSRNKGAEFSTAEYLFFVDVDNLITTKCMDSIRLFYSEKRDNIVLRANVRCSEEKIQHSTYAKYFDSRYLGSRLAKSQIVDMRFFASDAFILSRLSFFYIGKFDESFRHYGCEDEELGCRLRKNNFQLYFSLESLLVDDDSPTLTRACSRMIPYARYSVPLLLNKHPDAIDSLLLASLERRKSLNDNLVYYILYLSSFFKVGVILKYLLNLIDNKRIKIPSFIYKYVQGIYYMDGYRLR